MEKRRARRGKKRKKAHSDYHAEDSSTHPYPRSKNVKREHRCLSHSYSSSSVADTHQDEVSPSESSADDCDESSCLSDDEAQGRFSSQATSALNRSQTSDFGVKTKKCENPLTKKVPRYPSSITSPEKHKHNKTPAASGSKSSCNYHSGLSYGGSRNHSPIRKTPEKKLERLTISDFSSSKCTPVANDLPPCGINVNNINIQNHSSSHECCQQKEDLYRYLFDSSSSDNDTNNTICSSDDGFNGHFPDQITYANKQSHAKDSGVETKKNENLLTKKVPRYPSSILSSEKHIKHIETPAASGSKSSCSPIRVYQQPSRSYVPSPTLVTKSTSNSEVNNVQNGVSSIQRSDENGNYHSGLSYDGSRDYSSIRKTPEKKLERLNIFDFLSSKFTPSANDLSPCGINVNNINIQNHSSGQLKEDLYLSDSSSSDNNSNNINCSSDVEFNGHISDQTTPAIKQSFAKDSGVETKRSEKLLQERGIHSVSSSLSPKKHKHIETTATPTSESNFSPVHVHSQTSRTVAPKVIRKISSGFEVKHIQHDFTVIKSSGDGGNHQSGSLDEWPRPYSPHQNTQVSNKQQEQLTKSEFPNYVYDSVLDDLPSCRSNVKDINVHSNLSIDVSRQLKDDLYLSDSASSNSDIPNDDLSHNRISDNDSTHNRLSDNDSTHNRISDNDSNEQSWLSDIEMNVLCSRTSTLNSNKPKHSEASSAPVSKSSFLPVSVISQPSHTLSPNIVTTSSSDPEVKISHDGFSATKRNGEDCKHTSGSVYYGSTSFSPTQTLQDGLSHNGKSDNDSNEHSCLYDDNITTDNLPHGCSSVNDTNNHCLPSFKDLTPMEGALKAYHSSSEINFKTTDHISSPSLVQSTSARGSTLSPKSLKPKQQRYSKSDSSEKVSTTEPDILTSLPETLAQSQLVPIDTDDLFLSQEICEPQDFQRWQNNEEIEGNKKEISFGSLRGKIKPGPGRIPVFRPLVKTPAKDPMKNE